MTRIIGLTGPAGSGKSTVANILCGHLNFIELSFAEPIRQFIGNLCGLSPGDWDEHKENPHPMLCGRTPRHAMQTLGTEWGRHMIDHDLWIRQLEYDLRDPAYSGYDIVISDARFLNEAEWIRERGELWHLTRPGYGLTGHASEHGVPVKPEDFVLDNDCDLDELAHKIDLRIGAPAL